MSSVAPDLGPPETPDNGSSLEVWKRMMLLHRERSERIVDLEDRFGLGPKGRAAPTVLVLAAAEPFHLGFQSGGAFDAFRFHVARLFSDPRVAAAGQLVHHHAH